MSFPLMFDFVQRSLPAVRATVGRVSSFARVVIDGRQVSPGTIFFAIRGARFDGHAFVDQAIASGAAAAVIESRLAHTLSITPDVTVFEVDDTAVALARLATAYRNSLWHSV